MRSSAIGILPRRWCARSVDETGGNPFFVEELFRHLNEEGRLFDAHGRWRRDLEIDGIDVPAGIRTVIGRRLRRVSARTYEVLTAAAVIGRHFDLDLLEAVAGVDGDVLTAALEEAEQAHLVKGPSGRTERRWRFAHQLMRQTLTSALPQTRRERLHLRVADAMVRLDSRVATPTRRISHTIFTTRAGWRPRQDRARR